MLDSVNIALALTSTIKINYQWQTVFQYRAGCREYRTVYLLWDQHSKLNNIPYFNIEMGVSNIPLALRSTFKLKLQTVSQYRYLRHLVRYSKYVFTCILNVDLKTSAVFAASSSIFKMCKVALFKGSVQLQFECWTRAMFAKSSSIFISVFNFECWYQGHRDIRGIQLDIQTEYSTILLMLLTEPAQHSRNPVRYSKCVFNYILNVDLRASAIFASSSSILKLCVHVYFNCWSQRQRDIRGIQLGIQNEYSTTVWILISEPVWFSRIQVDILNVYSTIFWLLNSEP